MKRHPEPSSRTCSSLLRKAPCDLTPQVTTSRVYPARHLVGMVASRLSQHLFTTSTPISMYLLTSLA